MPEPLQSAGGNPLTLEVIAGNAVGTRIEVDDELLIGRHAEGPGRLEEDSEISRQHARVSREVTGGYAIEDLGSSNGTFLNGSQLTSPQLLGEGDLIEVGATTMVAHLLSSPAAHAELAPPTPGRAPTSTPGQAPTIYARTPAPVEDLTGREAGEELPAPAGKDPPPTEALPPPVPELRVALSVDFDAREATLSLDDGDAVQFTLENGRWRAQRTGGEDEAGASGG